MYVAPWGSLKLSRVARESQTWHASVLVNATANEVDLKGGNDAGKSLPVGAIDATKKRLCVRDNCDHRRLFPLRRGARAG